MERVHVQPPGAQRRTQVTVTQQHAQQPIRRTTRDRLPPCAPCVRTPRGADARPADRFDKAITCRPREEIGIAATPDESFVLTAEDRIDSVRREHREACAASRRAVADLGLDEYLHGNRRGPLPLRWVYFHVLRELAQHCGHADILREQILAG
ncbi:mycothiol transferase [Saccharomonospora iraqiensis]|uniref:mycothiol transferase n=1 Tax=Saccharomonospora iraqiensis TaxID=52698 RepID=UPI000A037B6B|nr:DUF664 domain-containing protein [Saccharomonospora iraqiensis]